MEANRSAEYGSISEGGNKMTRNVFVDSPVEQLRKRLPRGKGDWPTFGIVYSNLARAAEAMGLSGIRGNEFHVRTMAVMATGHEETMKSHLAFVRSYGWLG